MLWLSRPPYLRWIAAGALVVAALTWDLSKRQTEPFPFASQPIQRGSVITESLIEWHPLPMGMVSLPDLDSASAAVDIAAGDPITRSMASSSPPLPLGWWSVPVDLPQGVPSGASIRVILPDGNAVNGIVTHPAIDDGFGVLSPGTVGFPEAVADAVALLSSVGDLVILVEP